MCLVSEYFIVHVFSTIIFYQIGLVGIVTDFSSCIMIGVNGSCTLVDWWWCLLFLLLQLYFYNMGFLIIGICFYPCART
jgi:hypothetical protein